MLKVNIAYGVCCAGLGDSTIGNHDIIYRMLTVS
jgi:hypothetical protein